MRGSSFYCVLASLAMLLVAALGHGTLPATAGVPSVFLSVESASSSLGQSRTVSVGGFAEAPGVGSFNVSVHFDEAILDATACTVPTGNWTCNVDAGPGIVRLAGTSPGGLTNSFDLGDITFLAHAEFGYSVLSLTVEELLDPQGEEPLVETADGEYHIVQSTPNPPTATPTPAGPPPTATVEPTNTPAPPTDTPMQPTTTPMSPTDTPTEPTHTPVGPTDTPVCCPASGPTPTSRPLPTTPPPTPTESTITEGFTQRRLVDLSGTQELRQGESGFVIVTVHREGVTVVGPVELGINPVPLATGDEKEWVLYFGKSGATTLELHVDALNFTVGEYRPQQTQRMSVTDSEVAWHVGLAPKNDPISGQIVEVTLIQKPPNGEELPPGVSSSHSRIFKIQIEPRPTAPPDHRSTTFDRAVRVLAVALPAGIAPLLAFLNRRRIAAWFRSNFGN